MTFSFTLSIPAAVVARRKYFIEVNLGMTGHMSRKYDHAWGKLLTVRRLATIKDDAFFFFRFGRTTMGPN